MARKRSGSTGRPDTRSSSRTLARLTMCTHLAATSEKLWPAACTIFGRPAQLRLHVGGDELLDQLAPERRRELAARHLLAVAEDGERLGRVVEPGLERRQPLVAHQHQEVDLRQVPRRGGIEPSRAVLDGIGAVEGQRLARGERHPLQRLRREPLDGIAIQRADVRTFELRHLGRPAIFRSD